MPATGLLALLLLADPTILWLERFEATTASTPDAAAEWREIHIGAGGFEEWLRARAVVHLEQPPTAGEWLIRLGEPGVELVADLNGQRLEPVADTPALGDAARAGPTLRIPAAVLMAGDNLLEITFADPASGRAFPAGPAYLVAPGPAARLEELLAADEGDYPVANFSTLASMDARGSVGRRILARSTAPGQPFRLLGQLDVAVVGPEETEIPIGDLEQVRVVPYFPTASSSHKDARLPLFDTVQSVFSPISDEILALSRSTILLGSIKNQITRGKEFVFRYRLRFFPAVGGALHASVQDESVRLTNERVVLFAEKARLLGSPEQPEGIEITLEHDPQPNAHFVTLAGPSARFGVAAFEEAWLEGTRISDLAELVSRLEARAKDLEKATRSLGQGLVKASALEGGGSGGIATSRAARNLLVSRQVRSRSVLGPGDGGLHTAQAFWRTGADLLTFPKNSAMAVDWVLSTQDETGAVLWELGPAPGVRDQLEADLYAVLKATRHFGWTWDGDRFLPWADALLAALVHAATFDGDGDGLPDPQFLTSAGPTPYASPECLALAWVAAHRQLADTLEYLGRPDDAERPAEQAARAMDALLRPRAEGGGWNDTHFDLGIGEPVIADQTIAVLLDLLPEETQEVLLDELIRRSPEPGSSITSDLLLAWSLLQEGRIDSGRARLGHWLGVLRTAADPLEGDLAGVYDVLLFGLHGMRRDDLGMFSLMPRTLVGERIVSSILIPEGRISYQLSSPDVQFFRLLSLRNDSEVDLLITVGVPGRLGFGERVMVGSTPFSLYEELVEARGSWLESVR